MTTPAPRVAGKLGARPAVFPAGLRDLTHYVAGDLPKAPASVAVPKIAYGMDGNDSWGDCGPAGLNHGFMTAAAETSENETFPAAEQVVSYYLQYTGGQDSGVVLSDYLAYVRKNGFYGHTVQAYAPVSVHDVPTLQYAVNAYNFAYCGIAVTAQMQRDFADGKPWTLESLQSPVEGGHCVPAAGYDSQYLYVITWGAVQPVEWSAWHHMSTEAWAVITGEVVAKGSDGRGVNLAALRADLSKLDAPAPPPAPQSSHKSLLQELAALIRAGEKPVEDLRAWLDAHHL